MRNIQLIAVAFIILLAWSCGTDDENLEDTGTLSLQIQAKFDGETLYGDQEFILPDGKMAKVKQFNFFVSDLTVDFLEEGTAKITDLAEVEFTELTQTTASPLDPTDNTFQYFQLAKGDYTGLDFTLGLAKTFNDKTPADQDLGDGSPLRRSSHYWAAWGSYIFMKLEATIDFNDDGILSDDENIVYHTGSDNDGVGDDLTTHQAVSFPSAFTINKDATTELVVSLDIKDILYDEDGQQKWDIANRTTTHNADDFDLVQKVMESAANSFKMED